MGYMTKGKVAEWINQLLIKFGIDSRVADQMEKLVALFIIILIAGILWLLTKYVIIKGTTKVFAKISHNEKIVTYTNNIIRYLTNILLIFIVFLLLPAVFDKGSKFLIFLLRLCTISIVVLVIMIFDKISKIIYQILKEKPKYKLKPIRGFFQILQVIFITVGTIIIIAIIINKSPAGLLAGLGAFAAVLSLVFKDIILGFISGIQLSSNDMVKPGDWIVVPNTIANGIVMDISLITVKIRNWDNTIATVPNYTLITSSFQNWKGMEESGGRRILTSINIDMKSVTFSDNTNTVTNLELFRIYITRYLQTSPLINTNLTIMVRYLQPGPMGIPLQIWCFTKNKDWIIHEGIQSLILEHIIAMCPEYKLRIYQTAIDISTSN